jgi:hypothetical protein
MNKLLVVLGTATIMSVGGVVMWNAEATPLSGATNSLAVSKSYSAVQKTGCMFGRTVARRAPNGPALSIPDQWRQGKMRLPALLVAD